MSGVKRKRGGQGKRELAVFHEAATRGSELQRKLWRSRLCLLQGQLFDLHPGADEDATEIISVVANCAAQIGPHHFEEARLLKITTTKTVQPAPAAVADTSTASVQTTGEAQEAEETARTDAPADAQSEPQRLTQAQSESETVEAVETVKQPTEAEQKQSEGELTEQKLAAEESSQQMPAASISDVTVTAPAAAEPEVQVTETLAMQLRTGGKFISMPRYGLMLTASDSTSGPIIFTAQVIGGRTPGRASIHVQLTIDATHDQSTRTQVLDTLTAYLQDIDSVKDSSEDDGNNPPKIPSRVLAVEPIDLENLEPAPDESVPPPPPPKVYQQRPSRPRKPRAQSPSTAAAGADGDQTGLPADETPRPVKTPRRRRKSAIITADSTLETPKRPSAEQPDVKTPNTASDMVTAPAAAQPPVTPAMSAATAEPSAPLPSQQEPNDPAAEDESNAQTTPGGRIPDSNSKDAKSRRHHHVPVGWSCEMCGRSETVMRRKGPSGVNAACNSCGMRWAKAQKKGRQSIDVVDKPEAGETSVVGADVQEVKQELVDAATTSITTAATAPSDGQVSDMSDAPIAASTTETP
ncbi:white collar 2 type of transcription factor [Savitreella phatthalungensis]